MNISIQSKPHLLSVNMLPKRFSSSLWNYYKFSSTHFFLLLTTLVLCYSITYLLLRKKNNNHRLPPGPSGLPILGNLLMLGDLPHQTLCKLSKKYGPIMSIRLGLVQAVVVSSPEMAEMFLKTHDIVFASKPKYQAAEYIYHGNKGIGFTEYGPYWRNVRKICTLHLLSHLKIESFKSIRREEMIYFIKYIKELIVNEDGDEVVDVSEKVGSLVEDITYRMVLGAKTDRFNLKSIFHAILDSGAVNIADYVPYVGALDLQGLNRRLMPVRNRLDEFLDKIIEEHIQDAKQQESQHYEKDFIHVLLSLMETNEGKDLDLGIPNIKVIILEMLVGAIDTSSTTVEWALSELLRHPRVMELLQKELENVVGLDRMVEETDLVQLEYLEMVVKESMRLHPPGPLLAPHESREDIKINDYYIPKKTRLMVNIWAIGRDPHVWSNNVEEFYPERFMKTNIDLKGNDFRLIPFGSGRRGCPGIQLGLTMVLLILAQLIHCFNWELPNGMSPQDLDMTEKFGITLPRANHLRAIPTYRLNIRNL